jgi:uncharacterized protein
MDHEEITKLTLEYGGDWAINHSLRLLHLVSIIGEGMDYNEEAIWLAAYLHDWGGYTKWLQPGIEHYDRSVEVARDFLTEHGCPEDLKALVLEIIQYHHGGSSDRSIESKLFTDADMLDLQGVVGVLRIFSMVPRNLKGAIVAVKKYRDLCVTGASFPKTREIAQGRLQETEELLAKFEEETFGLY